ncbi:MAG: sulfur carrier protein ThiS [Nocardioidaceae bacterium]
MSIHVNGRPTDLCTGLTVQEVLTRLALPRRDVAVAVDGVVVPRSSWSESTVGPDSSVEVVTAMQGG